MKLHGAAITFSGGPPSVSSFTCSADMQNLSSCGLAHRAGAFCLSVEDWLTCRTSWSMLESGAHGKDSRASFDPPTDPRIRRAAVSTSPDFAVIVASLLPPQSLSQDGAASAWQTKRKESRSSVSLVELVLFKDKSFRVTIACEAFCGPLPAWRTARPALGCRAASQAPSARERGSSSPARSFPTVAAPRHCTHRYVYRRIPYILYVNHLNLLNQNMQDNERADGDHRKLLQHLGTLAYMTQDETQLLEQRSCGGLELVFRRNLVVISPAIPRNISSVEHRAQLSATASV
eukprot:1397522-Pleurochrysis_carterae.AAC.2